MNTDTKPSEAGEFPTLPQAPTLPAPDAQMLRRRKFLNWLCIGVGSVSLASIFWAVVGFMLAPLKSEGKSLWRNVGKVEDFKIGSTTIVKLEDSSTVPWAGYAGQTIWAVPCAGSIRRNCLCAHVMAGCTTRTAPLPPARRRNLCRSTRCVSEPTASKCWPARCRSNAA